MLERPEKGVCFHPAHGIPGNPKTPALYVDTQCVPHARKRLRGLRQDKRYLAAMDTYRKGERKKEELFALRMEYGLSEYQFHSWISIQQKKWKRYMDSLTAQKIVSTIWNSVEEGSRRASRTAGSVQCLPPYERRRGRTPGYRKM